MALPWWHPESLARRRPFLAARGAVQDAVLAHFRAEGFIQVDTPALQKSPGLERHIRPLGTRLRGPLDDPRAGAGEGRPRYLHTSPEFAMKKLLAGGLAQIVQLCHVWRDGEHGPLHRPEFTMLEWYRAHAGYETLIADCGAILRVAGEAARAVGQDGWLRWGERRCDASASLEVLTVQEAFVRFTGIDLLNTIDHPDAPAPDPARLRKAASDIGVQTGAHDTWEDVFFHIMLDRIEPKLGLGRATVLTEYPASLAALARRKPSDARVAERFELYACGVELANAYGELTDAHEQRARFLHDQALHEKLYGAAPPVDDDLLAALELLPPCAGAALGFDRLVMLCSGARDIADVLWAAVE